MILFQDEQAVDFDPMYVDGAVPWYERLYALYILAIVILLVVRIVQIILKLRKLRKLEQAGESGAGKWRQIWGLACLQARGLEKFAVLTFFLSVCVFAIHVSELAQQIVTMKASSIKWPLIYLGQKAGVVGVGFLTAALFYAVGFFF